MRFLGIFEAKKHTKMGQEPSAQMMRQAKTGL